MIILRDHISIELDYTGYALYDHSTYPHPLVTVDYDKEGNLIHIDIMGSLAERIVDLAETFIKYAEHAKK